MAGDFFSHTTRGTDPPLQWRAKARRKANAVFLRYLLQAQSLSTSMSVSSGAVFEARLVSW